MYVQNREIVWTGNEDKGAEREIGRIGKKDRGKVGVLIEICCTFTPSNAR